MTADAASELRAAIPAEFDIATLPGGYVVVSKGGVGFLITDLEIKDGLHLAKAARAIADWDAR